MSTCVDYKRAISCLRVWNLDLCVHVPTMCECFTTELLRARNASGAIQKMGTDGQSRQVAELETDPGHCNVLWACA